MVYSALLLRTFGISVKNDIFLFFQDFIFLCVQACAVAATQTVFAATASSDTIIVTMSLLAVAVCFCAIQK